MDFLSIQDTSYSDKKQGQSMKDRVNIVLSITNQGLEVQEQTKLNDFVGGLTDAHAKYMKSVVKSKPSNQEKAIISALLNKYPKLFTNEAQKREFREHLTNLLKKDKINEGAMKYLVERLLSKEADKPEQPEAPQPEPEAPEGEEGDDGEPAESGDNEEGNQPDSSQKAPAADTNNSDFFSDWDDDFNDAHTDLTEDDFNDLLDHKEVSGLLGESTFSTPQEFLINKDLSKEVVYSTRMLAEDFIAEKLMEREYSFTLANAKNYVKKNREAVGFVVGIIPTAVSYFGSVLDRRKFTKRAEELERSIKVNSTPGDRIVIESLIKELNLLGRTAATTKKIWESKKPQIQSTEVKRELELLIRLRVEIIKDSPDVKQVLNKALIGGIAGVTAAYFTRPEIYKQ